MENLSIAILLRVNELAERFGLKPYELVFDSSPDAEQVEHLHFEGLEPDIPEREMRKKEIQYARMIASLGLIYDDPSRFYQLEGARYIIDTLDKALSKAPPLQIE